MVTNHSRNVSYRSSLLPALIIALLVIFLFCLWSSSLQAFPSQYTTYINEHFVTAEKKLQSSEYAFDVGFGKNEKRDDIVLSSTNDSTAYLVSHTSLRSATPIHFTELNLPYADYPVYAFIDEEGRMQYRVYVRRVSESGRDEFGFVRAEVKFNGTSFDFILDSEYTFIAPGDERYGVITAVNAPAALVSGLKKDFSREGVYYRQGSNGNKEYYVYGHYPNGEDGFYLADSSGVMIPGTLSVLP